MTLFRRFIGVRHVDIKKAVRDAIGKDGILVNIELCEQIKECICYFRPFCSSDREQMVKDIERAMLEILPAKVKSSAIYTGTECTCKCQNEAYYD